MTRLVVLAACTLVLLSADSASARGGRGRGIGPQVSGAAKSGLRGRALSDYVHQLNAARGVGQPGGPGQGVGQGIDKGQNGKPASGKPDGVGGKPAGVGKPDGVGKPAGVGGKPAGVGGGKPAGAGGGKAVGGKPF
jgi:hypothetical protein